MYFTFSPVCLTSSDGRVVAHLRRRLGGRLLRLGRRPGNHLLSFLCDMIMPCYYVYVCLCYKLCVSCVCVCVFSLNMYFRVVIDLRRPGKHACAARSHGSILYHIRS